MDVARLFSGITYTNRLVIMESDRTAAAERLRPDSYTVDIKVTIERPRASSTLEDFRVNDPWLADAFAQIPDFEKSVQISPAFARLYDLKASWVKSRLERLDQLITRHNYYDCDTILEFKSSATGRRALILKGDMDVNTDGSDGDRNFEVDSSSPFFQPQTSYRWKRRTERPNPFLEITEKRLAAAKEEFAVKGLTPARNAELREAIDLLTRRLYDLKIWSFLISGADPAIVLPGFMLRSENDRPAYAAVGDYAVVLHGGKAYPAIVGDAGPSYKFGEGSLRLCRELNASSSANARPVSNLGVAYIVFPGSADEAGPPDFDLWHKRCSELLAEIGLGSLELHRWENIVTPWPTPTPSPTPEPTPGAVDDSPPATTQAPSDPPPTVAPGGLLVQPPVFQPTPTPSVSENLPAPSPSAP